MRTCFKLHPPVIALHCFVQPISHMHELQLVLAASPHDDPATVIENLCLANGLRQTLRGTLAAYPGCIHWHYKLNAQPGVLEITWWPEKKRAWVKVAANRGGVWITDMVPRIQHALLAA